jgi:hypothetical protein
MAVSSPPGRPRRPRVQVPQVAVSCATVLERLNAILGRCGQGVRLLDEEPARAPGFERYVLIDAETGAILHPDIDLLALAREWQALRPSERLGRPR